MCKKSVWGFWSCYKKAHLRLRMKAWILTMWQLFATTISTSCLQICVIRTCRSTPMITKIEVSSPQSAADTSYIVPMSLVSCSCNEWGSWIWPPTKTLLLCFLEADWYLICVISGLWAERQQACCEISRQDSSRHGHFQNCPQVWRHARWECWVSVCWRHTQRCYLRINTENRETYLPDSAKLLSYILQLILDKPHFFIHTSLGWLACKHTVRRLRQKAAALRNSSSTRLPINQRNCVFMSVTV